MGATATLSATSLAVDSGQEVTCEVAVRNSGTVVDQFVIEVVGEPARWATVEPAMVNLLPGEAATVAVRFAPPRSAAVLAGPAPFGIRVWSQEDPGGSVVEEGVVDVGAFAELTAEVVPPKIEAASRARYKIAVDNRGNYPVAVQLAARDPEGDLEFRLKRAELVLDPDSTAFVRLVARPRDRFLRGQPKRHRFEVSVIPAERAPIIAEATLVQRQLLPKWLVPALAALMVFALVLVGMWWFVMRPAVRSAAGDAAARQAAEVKALAENAQQDAGAAKQDAGAARQDSGAAKQNADRALTYLGVDPSAPPPSTPGGPPAVTVPVTAGDPTDFRIAADAPIDTNVRRFREFTFTPPDGKRLVVTDAILQNPRGDSGTLRLQRSTPAGPELMLEVGLGNFRDLDQHWVQPIVFEVGERIVLSVSCQNPPERGNCTPAVFFSGRTQG